MKAEPQGVGTKSETRSTISDLLMMDAVELSQAIRSKRVSCVEVMTAYLDHIERLNPKVNAIVSMQDRGGLMREATQRDVQLARGECLGWMHGFPHAIKDTAATKGIRTTVGSPLLDTVPQADALFVERIRKSGPIIIGKTNTPEFAMGSHTYNPIFGTTVNAYVPTKAAGGSSGGAAVSLALRMLPVADGSDMMGSLRNPAAYNNVLGFRPSYGRVPAGPTPEMFLTQLNTAGSMGRTARDVAMLLSVMAGPHPTEPHLIEQDPAMFTAGLDREFKGVRVGWLGDLDGYLAMEPGVMELCQESLKAFEAVGCVVEAVKLPMPPEHLWQTWLTLRHWLLAGRYMALYKDPAKRAQMKPEAVWEVEGGLGLKAQEVYEASTARTKWYQAICKMFESYEFLLMPSAQAFPFDADTPWPSSINGRTMDAYHRWMEVVVLAAIAGLPSISVPVGFSRDGLPMGMQIIGRGHADMAVLQMTHAYEQATNWVRKCLPPLIAG